MSAPVLTDLALEVTVAENTVNATPQIIDGDATLTDAEDNFAGGRLVVSGLGATERVSILDEGAIGFNAATGELSFNGVVFGQTRNGGDGVLRVDFDGDATTAAVEALIEHLTYANSSNSPSDGALTINLFDGAGENLGGIAGFDAFTPTLGDTAPFPDFWNISARLAFADLDGDGDLDVSVGGLLYGLRTYRNGTNGTSGAWIPMSGVDDPFAGFSISRGSPTYADIDGDGDQDLLFGTNDGAIRTFRNDGGAFTELTGANNPYGFVSTSDYARPSFADLDGDGDLDLVVGTMSISYFWRNDLSDPAGAFVELGYPATPLQISQFRSDSVFAFADLDGDADLDLILGFGNGDLEAWRNGGIGSTGNFVQLTGAANPFTAFNDHDQDYRTAPSFVDLDEDGDLDLVVGNSRGLIYVFENTGADGAPVITVSVTPEPEPPTIAGLPALATTAEDTLLSLDLSGATVGDLDSVAITVTLTASHGTLSASPYGTVIVGGSDTATLTLTGSPAEITALLTAAVGMVRYAPDANFNGSAEVVFTGDDGSGPVTLGTIDVAVSAVDDLPVLAMADATRTFDENTVNAMPVLLMPDATVTDVENDELTGASFAFAWLDPSDVISIRNQGQGVGQVGYDPDTRVVSYGGAAVATVFDNVPYSGNFMVLFTAGHVTAEMLQAVISNVTFASTSDNPTASRAVMARIDGTGFNSTLFIILQITAQDDPTSGPDNVVGSPLDDAIDGGDGDDTLDGGAGNDRLKGGLGDDHMVGGAGDDFYIVDQAGDTADETGGDGIDHVWARVSWTLGAGFENLTLSAPAREADGTGNALANVITGNDSANTLKGLAGNDVLLGAGGGDQLEGGDDDDYLDGGNGNDVLLGGAGVDELIGEAGHDRLDGGAGADHMTGGLGNDTYVVGATLSGDIIVELAGEGTDTVESDLGWVLGANLENLILTGSLDAAGGGNGLRNIITGNGAANALHGGGEVDTLSGGDGSDALWGEDGNDVLNGGADNDTLTGAQGSDKLTGGAGADTFGFIQEDLIAVAIEKDQILDLSFAEGDVIDLSAIDANTNLGGDQSFVWAVKFTRVAGQAVLTYASGVTTLALDVDGDGRSDFNIAITGDHAGTTGNLYLSGGGDMDGGWVL